MRILVCPDKFKGSLSASQVAQAMASGISQGWPEAEVAACPLADGGEGTLEVLVEAGRGRVEPVKVTGPLGEERVAHLGIIDGGRAAVVEMAAASGLELIPPQRRDPLVTTTAGTGDLIRAALDLGIRRIIVGVGGSGTNDGGTGMAAALGARFLDARGEELPPGGGALERLARIDLSRLDPRVRGSEIVVACDVDNPLLGPEGASFTYGPQKGARPQDLARLERGLARLAEVASPFAPRLAVQRGAGAAGGLGFGLAAFLGARLLPGIEVVMEWVGFEARLAGCGLLVTGEGRLDAQTSHGKTVSGVARAAARHGIPVLAVAGEIAAGAEKLRELSVSAMLGITSGPLSREESMRPASDLLHRTCRELAALLRVLAP